MTWPTPFSRRDGIGVNLHYADFVTFVIRFQSLSGNDLACAHVDGEDEPGGDRAGASAVEMDEPHAVLDPDVPGASNLELAADRSVRRRALDRADHRLQVVGVEAPGRHPGGEILPSATASSHG